MHLEPGIAVVPGLQVLGDEFAPFYAGIAFHVIYQIKDELIVKSLSSHEIISLNDYPYIYRLRKREGDYVVANFYPHAGDVPPNLSSG